jgi:hypothetical protein
MKKKNPLEEVLKRIEQLSDEEKAAIYKEARESMNDVGELEHQIVDVVISWMEDHRHDDNVVPKMITGLQKGVCHVLVTLDESNEDGGRKPSSAFLAMLPIGLILAKKEYDLREQMEHERLMREGAN